VLGSFEREGAVVELASDHFPKAREVHDVLSPGSQTFDGSEHSPVSCAAQLPDAGALR
jgi:hypothetical protein